MVIASNNIVPVLKACVKEKDLLKGSRVHVDILRRGLLYKDCFIACALVNMYAKCGALLRAEQVLDDLPFRDAITWGALISGYVQQGQGKVALNCFGRMQCEGLSVNAVICISIVKACGSIGAIEQGERIHEDIIRQGLLQQDVALGNALVDMYAKCGALGKAAEVLYSLPVHSTISWNALIAGYNGQGQSEEALKCFEQMHNAGFSPNAITFTCILKACGSVQAAHKGEEIYRDIVRQGIWEKDIVLGNAVVDMYIKCGVITKAANVLEELPVRDMISWAILIAGYAQQYSWEDALICFDRMQFEGFFPNEVTLLCILKACGSLKALTKGEQVHKEIARQELVRNDNLLGNALVDMYAKCGALMKAERMLCELPFKEVGSCNSLISRYVEQGQPKKAFKCFEWMQNEGVIPNTVTFICVSKACGSIGALCNCEHIHSEILRHGLLGRDIFLDTALVDMYAKCGALGKAEQLLGSLPVRDQVCWSSLIAGYVQEAQGEEALNCVEQMQREGFLPDTVTFISILKACGSIGAIAKGEQVHNEIVRKGFSAGNMVLGTSLVDMYAKCGALYKAMQVHDELHIHNVVSWSALITGYTQQGQSDRALKCFEQMQHEGFSPDSVIFASVLSACSRLGLLEGAQILSSNVLSDYSVSLDVEHRTCIVDLFARAGKLAEAVTVIKKMQSYEYLPVWLALLSACRECGNVKVAKSAFKSAIKIDKSDASAYVLMTEIYAGGGMQDDGNNIAAMREMWINEFT